MTSKLQLTIPKAVADQYGISPGDEVDLTASGAFIRMAPSSSRRRNLPPAEKVRLLKQLLQRGRSRRKGALRTRHAKTPAERERGWTREELYTRGGSR